MIDHYLLRFWRVESSKLKLQGLWWLVRPALPIWELLHIRTLLFYGRKERGQMRVPINLISFQAFVLTHLPKPSSLNICAPGVQFQHECQKEASPYKSNEMGARVLRGIAIIWGKIHQVTVCNFPPRTSCLPA